MVDCNVIGCAHHHVHHPCNCVKVKYETLTSPESCSDYQKKNEPRNEKESIPTQPPDSFCQKLNLIADNLVDLRIKRATLHADLNKINTEIASLEAEHERTNFERKNALIAETPLLTKKGKKKTSNRKSIEAKLRALGLKSNDIADIIKELCR